MTYEETVLHAETARLRADVARLQAHSAAQRGLLLGLIDLLLTRDVIARQPLNDFVTTLCTGYEATDNPLASMQTVLFLREQLRNPEHQPAAQAAAESPCAASPSP